jgi:hypothetical protein
MPEQFGSFSNSSSTAEEDGDKNTDPEATVLGCSVEQISKIGRTLQGAGAVACRVKEHVYANLSDTHDIMVSRIEKVTLMNSHFPAMVTVPGVDRPYRPSLPRLAARTVDYCTRWSMPSVVEGINANSRVLDPELRKAVLSQLSTIDLVNMPKAHSHAMAASERTSVAIALRKAVLGCGLKPYDVSGGTRERIFDGETRQWTRPHGCRFPYFVKDLSTELFIDAVEPDDAFVFVDVDYYTDVNTWARYGRLMVFYTFVPVSAAAINNDSAMEFFEGKYVDKAGRAHHQGTMLSTRVKGGEHYEHPLWDWSVGGFSVVDWWGNYISYLVESRACPSGRRIVVAVPSRVVAFPYWKSIPVEPLRRLDVMVAAPGGGKIPVLLCHSTGMVSVGAPGTTTSLQITRLDFEGLVVKYEFSKTKYPGDMEKWLRVCTSKQARDEATAWGPVVFRLISSGWRLPNSSGGVIDTSSVVMKEVSAPTVPDVVHYVLDQPDGKEDGKGISGGEIARNFAPPMVTIPVPCPARVTANAAMAYELRVKSTQRKFSDHVFAKELDKYAAEFVAQTLVGIRGTVVPLDLSQLEERWTRPSQRQGLNTVHTWVPSDDETRKVDGFMKGELGYKPRQIVNENASHNAPLGCYVLPAMDVLKGFHEWVGCGRTPEEIERRVNAVAKGTCVPQHVLDKYRLLIGLLAHEGDISNCDGSEKRWHREHLIYPILMCIMAAPYRKTLRGILHGERAGKTVKMKEGFSYLTEFELLSGTSLTTFSNIMKVAFGDYCALRESGMSPEDAFACLGVYCGDDSVMVGLSIPNLAETRVRVMAMLAMDQKLIIRQSPDPVSFLGEYHYGAFADGGQKLPDFWRQVQKCHSTTARGIPIELAAANKAAGMLSSSSAADPLLGPWAEKVAELAGRKAILDSATRDEQWLMAHGIPDMNKARALRASLRSQWSAQTGIDLATLDSIVAIISNATTLAELPAGVLDNVLIAKRPADGITQVGSHAEPSSAPADNKDVGEERPKTQGPPAGAGRPGRGGFNRGRGSRPAQTRPPPPAAPPSRGRGRGQPVPHGNHAPVQPSGRRGARA